MLQHHANSAFARLDDTLLDFVMTQSSQRKQQPKLGDGVSVYEFLVSQLHISIESVPPIEDVEEADRMDFFDESGLS